MRTVRLLLVNAALSLLIVAVAVLILAADALWSFQLPGSLAWLAWPLLAAGSILIVWTVMTFLQESGSSGAVGDRPARLVIGGPFRLIRNPLYAGLALLLLGVALWARSPSFLTAALVYPLVIDVYVRKVEERRLTSRFGSDYRSFCSGVPRWFPRLRDGPRTGPVQPDTHHART